MHLRPCIVAWTVVGWNRGTPIGYIVEGGIGSVLLMPCGQSAGLGCRSLSVLLRRSVLILLLLFPRLAYASEQGLVIEGRVHRRRV